MLNSLVFVAFGAIVCLAVLMGTGMVKIFPSKEELEKMKKERGNRKRLFEEKAAFEYTPKEKKWILLIGIFGLACSGLSYYSLIFLHRQDLASLILAVIPIGWFLLIKLGNKTTK